MNRIVVLSLMIVVASLGCSSGFSDKDVEDIKSSIRSHYEKVSRADGCGINGNPVSEVSMMKVSDRKLKGFARVEVKLWDYVYNNGYFCIDVNKECTAEMSTDDKHYLWKCQ